MDRITRWRKDVTQPPSPRRSVEPKAQPPAPQQWSDEGSSQSESPPKLKSNFARAKGDMDRYYEKKHEETAPSLVDRWRKDVSQPPSPRRSVESKAQPPQQLNDEGSSEESSSGPSESPKGKSFARAKGDLDRYYEKKHEETAPSLVDRWRKDVSQPPSPRRSVESKAQPPQQLNDEGSSEESSTGPSESPKGKSFARAKGDLDRYYEKKHEETAPSLVDRWRKDVTQPPSPRRSVESKAQPPQQLSDEGSSEESSSPSESPKGKSFARAKGDLDRYYEKKHEETAPSLVDRWRRGVGDPPNLHQAQSPSSPKTTEYPRNEDAGFKPKSLVKAKGDLDEYYQMKHSKEAPSLIESWRERVTQPPSQPMQMVSRKLPGAGLTGAPPRSMIPDSTPVRDEAGSRVQSSRKEVELNIRADNRSSHATKPSARPARSLCTRSYRSLSQRNPADLHMAHDQAHSNHEIPYFRSPADSDSEQNRLRCQAVPNVTTSTQQFSNPTSTTSYPNDSGSKQYHSTMPYAHSGQSKHGMSRLLHGHDHHVPRNPMLTVSRRGSSPNVQEGDQGGEILSSVSVEGIKFSVSTSASSS